MEEFWNNAIFTQKLPPQYKEAWLTELRSGLHGKAYRQYRSDALDKTPYYCAVGVLYYKVLYQGPLSNESNAREITALLFQHEATGKKEREVYAVLTPHRIITLLSDTNPTFQQAADWIEENL